MGRFECQNGKKIFWRSGVYKRGNYESTLSLLEGVRDHDPEAGLIIDSKKPPAWAEGGTWTYPLGTDAIGRDVLSRLLFGTRTSLLSHLTTRSGAPPWTAS